MKEIVREHPLRPIILRFDLDKPQLEFEAKGLAAHYRMHDLAWDMQQQLREHYEVLTDLDIRLSELDYRLDAIVYNLNILEGFLQIRDPASLPPDEYNKEVVINVAEFFSEVIDHSKMMEDIHKPIRAEFDWFKAYFDMIYEKESWIDQALWDDVHQIYRNYQDAQVDIVTLDRDQEEFRGVLAEIDQLEDAYREYGDTVWGMYKRIHAKADDCYRRCEAVDKGFDELEGRE